MKSTLIIFNRMNSEVPTVHQGPSQPTSPHPPTNLIPQKIHPIRPKSIHRLLNLTTNPSQIDQISLLLVQLTKNLQNGLMRFWADLADQGTFQPLQIVYEEESRRVWTNSIIFLANSLFSLLAVTKTLPSTIMYLSSSMTNKTAL